MKRKLHKLTLVICLMMVVSCDEPETVVTNYIHSDGSVTRKIEMRNVENKFEVSDLQIPFDSTWTVTDSLELSEKGDTTWVRRAVKLFRSVAEINELYKQDSGANRDISRNASFSKSFRWFNTVFRFSEKIGKKIKYGYPIQDFLNQEELTFFYSPETLKDEKKDGQDSLKYRALNDTINEKTEKWATRSLVSEWIGEFSELSGKGNDSLITGLRNREEDLIKIVELNSEKFDSLWENGIILKEFLGESNALKYKKEADSAVTSVTNNFWVNFKDYSVRIVMPGNLTRTNGFIDSSKILLWPVKSDFFLTQPYEMWAESKVPNTWAWIVSGFFVIFVLTGVIIKTIKKG